MSKMDKFVCFACIPFTHEPPGFAMPIFRNSSDLSLVWVQMIDEYTNCVCDFNILGNLESKVYSISVNEFPEMSRGGEPIYAFITEKGEANVGAVAGLTPILRSFLVRCPEYTGICLQVMELIGAKEELRDARFKMRSVISRRSGSVAAASFYERSALRSAMWTKLIRSAPSVEAARRILAVRPRLDIEVDNEGEIVLRLDALSENDRAAIDTADLVEELTSEFDLKGLEAFRDELTEALEAKSERRKLDAHVEGVVWELRSSGRQERRLAIIFAELLNDINAGKEILEVYQKDNAEFTSDRLRRIRYALKEEGGNSKDGAERIVYGEIYRTLVDFYGLTKGILMLEFAQKLGKYPRVYAMIKTRTDNSGANDVQAHRDEIIRALTAAADVGKNIDV